MFAFIKVWFKIRRFQVDITRPVQYFNADNNREFPEKLEIKRKSTKLTLFYIKNYLIKNIVKNINISLS